MPHHEHDLPPYPVTLHVYTHPAEGPFAPPPEGASEQERNLHELLFATTETQRLQTEGTEAFVVSRKRLLPGHFAIHVRLGTEAHILVHEIVHLLTHLERQSYLRTRPGNDEHSAYLAGYIFELVAQDLHDDGGDATITVVDECDVREP